MSGTKTSSDETYQPSAAVRTRKRPCDSAQHQSSPKTARLAASAPSSAVTTTIGRKPSQPPTRQTVQQATPRACTSVTTAPATTRPPVRTIGVRLNYSNGVSEKEVSAQYDDFFVRFDNLLKRFPLVKIDDEFFRRLPVTASGKLLTDLLGSMTELKAIMEAARPPEAPATPPEVGPSPIDAELVDELTLIEQWRADGRAGFVGCKDKAALEYLNKQLIADVRLQTVVKSAFAKVSPHASHRQEPQAMIGAMLAKLLPVSSFRYYARSSPACLKHTTVADEDGELVARTIFDEKLNYIWQLMKNRVVEALYSDSPLRNEPRMCSGLSSVLHRIHQRFLKESQPPSPEDGSDDA